MTYVFASLLGVFALAGMPLTRHRHQVVASLRDYFSATEDLWSWTTQDGRSYEDGEAESVDGGEVTVSMKLRRAIVLEKYREELEQLW